MTLRCVCAFFLISSWFLPPSSPAQTTLKDSVWRVKKTEDFQLTGEGTAPHWKNANLMTLPQRKRGGSAYQTQAKILYSDTGIYCLFQCQDTKITATLKADFLDLYKEDVVEVFFWTDQKVPIYFEYELSPLNYELPILVPNANGDFFGWRPWHYEGERKTRHATHVNGQGNNVISWTAELFIPFALLKPLTNVPPQKGSRWRANFYRIDYDTGQSSWSWQLTRTSFHDYERFGTIWFD